MADKPRHILVINPGSTSTKLAWFRNSRCKAEKLIAHPKKELLKFTRVMEQLEYRLEHVREFLEEKKIGLDLVSAVAARGGLLKPVQSGVYAVNARMLEDLAASVGGEHPSNLGAPIADRLAKEAGCPAFIADPPVVDELSPIARYSGHPDYPRKCIFHALSQKAAAKKAASSLGKKYESGNFIVAHLGGGFSVGAHREGRVIDVNNALDGEGPFSPQRAGGLPAATVAERCFQEKADKEKLLSIFRRAGGLYAYLGTQDCRKVEARIAAGDKKALMVYEAMAYRTGREIGAACASLRGRVDAVVLAGGLAGSKFFVKLVKKYAGFIAPFKVYPLMEEMTALANAALAALHGNAPVKEYAP